MRRAQSLQKAFYALIILATFMAMLRFSQPVSDAALAKIKEAPNLIHHDSPSTSAAAVTATKEAQNLKPPEGTAKANAQATENAHHAASATPESSESSDAENKAPAYDAGKMFEQIIHGEDSPPVVIFSKSYCPHSMRAKQLLLETYSINPPPKVVELDIVNHGGELQTHITEVSGRRTVPNIFVNGVSRGGASDMVELEDSIVTSFLEWGQGKLSIVKQQAIVQE